MSRISYVSLNHADSQADSFNHPDKSVKCQRWSIDFYIKNPDHIKYEDEPEWIVSTMAFTEYHDRPFIDDSSLLQRDDKEEALIFLKKTLKDLVTCVSSDDYRGFKLKPYDKYAYSMEYNRELSDPFEKGHFDREGRSHNMFPKC